MLKIVKKLLLASCVVGAAASAAGAVEVSAGISTDISLVPERRKPQFSTDFGYALFPYPYSLPGIGKGLGLVGGAMNIAGTYTDAYGIIFTGDVRGAAAGVADIHIIPRNLILDVGYSTVSEATIQSLSQRGMNTDKNDYRLIEFGDTEYYGGRMTTTFLDRRFEVYDAWDQGAKKLKSIRDKEGNGIDEAQN